MQTGHSFYISTQSLDLYMSKRAERQMPITNLITKRAGLSALIYGGGEINKQSVHSFDISSSQISIGAD